MVDPTFARLLHVRGGGVMGRWVPKFVRVQAGVLEVYRDPEGNGPAGTTARLEEIAEVTIDEARDECNITLQGGGKIRARADELEVLNLFAGALQPGLDPAGARQPRVVLRPRRDADSPGSPTADSERSLQPEPDVQDVQDQGSGRNLENLPVHERLYSHAALKQEKLEQRKQQLAREEDQAIEDSMAHWNALKHEKEKKRAKDPNFNEDPRDFHERTQAYEIAKQLKVRQRREEMLLEEEMRLEEERVNAMPTRQVGQNYDPYEAADRLYRNALHKGRQKEGDVADFSEAAKKRRTEEEQKADAEAQEREEAEQRRKEKERQRRDKLVEDGKKRKQKKAEEAEKQKQKAKTSETKADNEKSLKAQENRRKSAAFLQRNARPKSQKKGAEEGDPRSASPGAPHPSKGSDSDRDAKPASPKAKAKAKGSWPREARSTSPTTRDQERSQRLAEAAEAGAPRVGRKSQIAKRAEKMHDLERRLVEEDHNKFHAQHNKDRARQGADAKFAERLWGIQQPRVESSRRGGAEGVSQAEESSDPEEAPDASLDVRSPRCPKPMRDKESHLLDRLCEKIEARTGEDQMELEGEGERQAMEHSLKRVRSLFAAAEAESKSDGFDDLCKLPNHRLVRGALLPEVQDSTRARAGPPDPIFQQMENLDGLIEAGEAAQTVLMEELQEPWEVGETLQLPANVPAALFAYNPGPMSRDEAEIRAMVLYGPVDGAQCHRNLLDVARLTLVFPTCTVLKLGLDAVQSQFEVVKVHNYFRDPSPLGGRYVDVFVLIDLSQDPGLPYPYVCKLRLETLPYFQATAESEAVLEGLYDTLCENAVSRFVAQSYLEFPEKKLARDCRRKFEAAYGSTLAAWRHAFGRKRLVTFDAFREAHDRLRSPVARTPAGDNLHETWSQFDPCLSGRITYFDFDPDSASLLTKLRSRFMLMYGYGDQLNDYKIYEQMTCLITPKKPMEWDVNEFKAVMGPFCMTTAEVDKVMQLLDQHGGKQNPVTIRIQDVMFLLRLPDMFDVDTAVIDNLNMVSKAPPPRAGFGYAGEDGRFLRGSESPSSPRPKLTSGLTRHLALPAYDEDF